MSIPSPTLLTIIAHARSGALDHAWRLFREAGLEDVADDPAVLSLKGRLLKDQALSTGGVAGRALYRHAADAYGRAGAISGATYPLINAATLALLADDPEQARRRARDVLARLEAGEPEPDTPYYQAATRAEALVLLGETAAARAALDEAMARAPRAWEDHASTLQQLARILAAQGADAAWLDRLRPPRCLHFGGHIAVGPDDLETAAAVRDVLEAEGVGFGYGALAAGADIIIAEALLARGAELHLTLPAAPAVFRAASVAGRGGGWGERFDAALARADSLVWPGHADDRPTPPGLQLAAEAAMGAAVMQARTLATEAVQLLVLDAADPVAGEPGGSAWMGEAWRRAGGRQHRLRARRVGVPPAVADVPARALAAVLLVEAAEPVDGGLAAADLFAARVLPRLEALVAGLPTMLAPPSWRGGSVQLAFATPREAAAAALAFGAALRDEAAVRIAGAYGQAPLDGEGRVRLVGPTAAMSLEILRSVPPGAIHLAEPFAMALLAAPDGLSVRLEYVGDLAGDDIERPDRLYSLKAAPTG